MRGMTPAGIYVHLPFCSVHCTYCPFAISTDVSLEEAYVDALLQEIDAAARRLPAGRRATDTVYFGGGTPSRLTASNLARIMSSLRDRFDIQIGCEISLEANPEDVTPDAIAAWQTIGVNRLSIGVQSFNDAELRPLGRLHSAAGARNAVAASVATGIRTNVDLIAGLPGQSVSSFQETLETAIGLRVGHLSLYMLDLEEGTPLEVQVARGRTSIPEDENVAAMYTHAIARLTAAGLQQYEISNFARPGEECLHNIRYWERGEYHGFGLGAHSFVGGARFANTRSIRHYIEQPCGAVEMRETIGEAEERRETLFLGLRRTRGIHYRRLVELCGEEGIEWVDRGLCDGWLRREGEHVAFTPAGFLLSNDYISQLF